MAFRPVENYSVLTPFKVKRLFIDISKRSLKLVFVTRSVHNHCWCSFTIHIVARKMKGVQFVYNLTFFGDRYFCIKNRFSNKI